MRNNPKLSSFHANDINRKCSGSVLVKRGDMPQVKLICTVIQLPSDYDTQEERVDIQVTTNRLDGSEKWHRIFKKSGCDEGTEFITFQILYNEELIEQFGILKFCFRIRIDENAYIFESYKGYLSLPLLPSLPLPQLITPFITATSTATRNIINDLERNGVWSFNVEIRGPKWTDAIVGMILQYTGNITEVSE